MNFFIELFKTNSGVSSKRFISLFSLILFTAIVVADVFFNYEVNDIIYYSIVSLVLGSSVMTLTQNKTSSTSTDTKENL
jgi:hypothetical protein